MTDRANTWGELIRSHRKALELLQVDLAELVGVTQATVSGWEVGSRTPPPASQAALVRILDISADELHAVVSGAAA